jgi:hypothetical protein
MSDEAERLYQLRDEFDIEAQRQEIARDAATTSIAEDEFRTIEVELVDGVPAVTVRDGWKQRRDATELGSDIMGVVLSLGLKRLEESQQAAPDTAPRARPTPSVGATPAGLAQTAIDQRGDELDPSVLLGRLTSMIDTIASGMEETMRTLVERGSVATEAESLPGHVTAELRGRTLHGLRFDEEWLEYAGPGEISRETNEAIAAAVRLAAAETPPNPLEGTPLAGFASVLDDPAAMSRYLLGEEDFSAPTERR